MTGYDSKRDAAADKLLEEATRSCNNIDEQRALDALMREAQPAQEPKRPYQLGGMEWLSERTRTISVKSGASLVMTWDFDHQNCDVVISVAQPAQKPVARVAEVHMSRYTLEWTNGPLPEGTELFAAPQRKPWVSLSDGQRKEIIKRECRYTSEAAQLDHQHLCYAIDAKLKERNHGT